MAIVAHARLTQAQDLGNVTDRPPLHRIQNGVNPLHQPQVIPRIRLMQTFHQLLDLSWLQVVFVNRKQTHLIIEKVPTCVDQPEF